MEKNKKNHNTASLIVLVGCLIVSCVYSASMLLVNKNKGGTINITVDNRESLVLEDTSNYTNKIAFDFVYWSYEDDYYIVNEGADSYKNKAVEIKVKNEVVYDEEDPSNRLYDYSYTNYKKKYILYQDDNKVKIYDIDNNISYITNVPVDMSAYTIIVDENEKLLGVLYFNDVDDKNYPSRNYYFSFNTNSNIYNSYNSLEDLEGKYLVGEVFKCNRKDICTFEKTDILDVKGEKVLKSIKVSDELGVDVDYKSNYIFVSEKMAYGYIIQVLNNNLDSIVDFSKKHLDPLMISIDKDDNLCVVNNNKLKVYNTNGEVVKAKTIDGKVLFTDKGYVLTSNNNKIMAYTTDDDVLTIGKSGKVIHYYREELKKDNLVYFGVIDSTVSLDEAFKSCKEYSCEYENMNELKKAVNRKSVRIGYEYIINIETKKVTKNVSVLGPSI